MIDPAWSLETLEEHVHGMEYQLFPKVIAQITENLNKEKEVM